MKQLHITFLLTLLMSMVGAKALAGYDAQINGIYYYFSGTDAIVAFPYNSVTNGRNYNHYTGTIIIPESVTYNGVSYSVTSIGGSAFYGCPNLTSVTIPNSVTNIGNNAFEGCSGLTSVTIPNSVTSIGVDAFRGCFGLTSVTIPNSVTIIGERAFSGCSGLTSITIPNSVTSIYRWAFEDCYGLTEVNFNATNCTSMGSSTFPVFKNCPFTTLNIGNNVQNIPNDAFSGCSGLTSVTIPNSVTSIGEYTFYGCSGLTSVTIPNSVTSIGKYAFYGCHNLKSVTIGTGILSIGSSIFDNHKPAKVIWLGITPPNGCGNAAGSVNYVPNNNYNGYLSNIMVYDALFEEDNILYMSINSSNGSCRVIGCHQKGVVNLPETVVDNGATYSVTDIDSYAFCGNPDLTSVTIPNSVTSIGDAAFSGCSGLQSVVLGNGVTIIPNNAFDTGTNIKSFTVGAGVLSISSKAFGSYRPIKTIWLTNTPPSGYAYAVGTINYVANNLYTNLSNTTEYKFLSSLFEVDGVKYVPVSPSERTCDAIDCLYNERAENVNIGETVSYKGVEMSVQRVHDYACYSNSYIKKAKVSINGYIGALAFYGCTTLTTATLGEAVTGIGNEAFRGCSSLQSIVIPNAVTNLGESAFNGCSQMTSVKMGTGVKTIRTYAFASCSALTSMQLGSKAETIGERAFYNCKALPEIEIPKSVKTINNYAFSGCSGLKDVVIADRDTILTLGSNGSSPLFSSCPLDSVYIGGNINYNTSSSYGYSPFYRNTSLRTVVITDKETEISENEFYGCTNLQDVKIGDGVESFGDWAFSGCSSLKHLSFGTSVKRIGKEAFSDCAAVTQIVSRAQTPPVCGSQALDDINKWECTLKVPIGGLATYQKADQWKEFFFMEEYETGISDMAIDKPAEEHYFTIDGKRLDKLQKGLNIVVMPDGTTRKVVVK